MNNHKRLAVHAAARIRQSMAMMGTASPSLALPDTAWSQCVRLVRQIDKALHWGWYGAARRLRNELVCAISTCHRRLEQVESELEGHDAHQTVPTQRDLLQELIALEGEFDEVDLGRKATLSVVTEPIILEGVNLGRFEIALDTDSDPHRAWGFYEVIALDSNPAASDSNTTHPHVQGDQLCEGEGRVSIRRALQEGRLFDFFVLVRQILQTYNPASAYVRLEDWGGVECRDCGQLTSQDDREHCEHCESRVCFDCSYVCAGCSESFCSECTGTCSGCEERFCRSCLETCAGCTGPFCQECLTDEKCSTCREGGRKEGQEEEKQTEPPLSGKQGRARASLHPVRVGEAPVPA